MSDQLYPRHSTMIYLAQVREGGIREAENAVDRVAVEAAGERSHRREVLTSDANARNGNC